MKSAVGQRFALLVVVGLLLVWEPVTFAWRASAALARIGEHGLPAFLLLGVRAVVIGVGIAAGRALLAGERHGTVLGQLFFLASALAAGWTAATPYFPSNGAPSEQPWRLAASLAYYGAGWAYLQWSSLRTQKRTASDSSPDA